MGGLSTDISIPSEPSRDVTAEEAEIAQSKGLPCPILIVLSREQEFLEYLNDEHSCKA